jgi:hypothetical protein
MELKFKEVDGLYKESWIENIKIKPFLTIEELSDIVNSCLSTDVILDRYWIKAVMVARFCTNIELGTEDITKEEYNLIAELGLISEFETAIDNYYVIDKCLKDSETTYRCLKDMTNLINDKIDEAMNKINPESTKELFGQFKELLAK